MQRNKQIIGITLAATSAGLVALILSQLLVSFLPNCGPHSKFGCYDTTLAALLGIYLISNTIGGTILYFKSIHNYGWIALFAAGLTYFLQAIANINVPTAIALLIFFANFLVSYGAGYLVFNSTKMARWQKIISALFIIIIIAILLQLAGHGYVPS